MSENSQFSFNRPYKPFGFNIQVPERTIKQAEQSLGNLIKAPTEPLFNFLEENEEVFNVVATLSDAKDVFEVCKEYKPDLVLMDICTENNSNGIAYSKILKETFPEIKIIIMTGIMDINFVNEAKEFNIDSFIYKSVTKETLITAIKNTLDGYSIYPNEKTLPCETAILQDLTSTELLVLTKYCKLLDRKDVANSLGISTSTLKTHISSIYAKTGYDNLTKLAVYCISNGLIVTNLDEPEI